ncbi:ABC transporter permease [Streptomyces sp. Wb2n-11]|uniref:ABC transporter permease n=1 Tax=Streptomyces sp. Wb2n-11 TaxID=1030533 RepID=UPI000A53F630|nr:ABC transporter permease [Streptomyces sp. Wb2n-11]
MNTPAHRVTPGRVLRSEWHKLWTLRSTWITLLTASALTLGIGLLMGATYTTGGGDGDVDTVLLVLIGIQFAQIALAVLGILVTAGEYSTGMIRASLTAVPRRLPVLWSKAAVFGAVTFALTLVTAFVTFLTAQLFLSGTDQAASLGDPGVVRALTGSAAALTLLGLIALGLGALLRSVPGAVGAFVGGVMILPEVFAMLPYDIVGDAVEYFPSKSVEVLVSAQTVPGAASPGAALLALVLWAAASLAAAGLLLERRDV